MKRIQRMGRWVSARMISARMVTAIVLAGGLVLPSMAGEPAWETDLAWKAAAMGDAAGGKHEWNAEAGTMVLTGSGVGLNAREADQCQFVYIDRPAGDFEIVVRLTDFAGDKDAFAGIMVRQAQDDVPGGAVVALYYDPSRNAVAMRSRIPAGKATPANRFPIMRGNGNGSVLAQKGPADKAPLWLRLVRIDTNFAVYKSRDGRLWSMITNNSGGPHALEGPLRVGVFCTSGAADKTATATFDSIRVGDQHMRYRTSWVGNSFGCRTEDGHVSNGLSAMWVSADGTCYTSSYWDEAGQPVKSYRDGKVLRPLPIGTPQTAQGGITGDDKRVFVASVFRYNRLAFGNITELDPAAADYAPKFITLSLDLLDRKTNHSVVSGMASNGEELFVADQLANLIRVVSLSPPEGAFSASESSNAQTYLTVTPVEVPEAAPEDAPPFAPAMVYQSQRAGENVTYNFPGLTPGGTYTVRCHLAEFVKRPENVDDRNRYVTIGSGNDAPRVYVAQEAGGEYKALAKDFPNFKADDKGSLRFRFGAYGGPGLCGIEVLDADGKRIAAVNCGGPDADGFKGECPELLDRNFAFANPGVMTFDKRGHLWIIQREVEATEATPGTRAAVKCYTTDGQFTGREITDVVNPHALAYDAAKDQLLVGVNLPDVNVRFYEKLDTEPKLARTFGAQGGIYAGEHPGLVYDPAAGGYARFAGINGLGVDAKGNLYVGGGWQGSDLRMFAPDGQFGWMLNSLMFCATYDVDPASDGADIYGTYNRLRLDLDKPLPGSEQTYVSYNWDQRRFGGPQLARAHSSQAIVRRLGEGKNLIMFTSGQGNMLDTFIFRYEGELAIPCGTIRRDGTMWIDADGDGKESPDEVMKMDSGGYGGHTALCVDSRGDMWVGVPTTSGSYMRHFFFKGLNEHGVPVYGHRKGEDYEDLRFPDEGDKTSAWSMGVRLDYDADRDIMILYFPCVARTGEDDKSPRRYKLARYDNWSKGNRDATWKIDAVTAYDPEQAHHFMYETNLFPYAGYMGMQLAGDYVFFAYLFGEVHVYDAKTGEMVEMLSMGPEVAGSSAWEDASMGLRAFKRTNGEYLIFTENSGWGGKNHFFRWTPEKK